MALGIFEFRYENVGKNEKIEAEGEAKQRGLFNLVPFQPSFGSL